MGNKKVLIVDDELSVVMFMKNYLRRRKIEAYAAKNGREALELFEKLKPEIVFLDINMEGLDGLQVLKEMKLRLPKTRVFMLTGREDRQAKQKSTRFGAEGFITKPIILEEFEKVLELSL